MICVDASLAAKWVLAEEYSENALALLTKCVRARERMLAPALLPIELTNILRQRMVRDQVGWTDALELLRRLLSFPVFVSSPPQLHEQALAIANAYDLPATYDAHYLALAKLAGCNLWTDDRRMLRLLGGRLGFVKWIGEYGGDAIPG